MSSCSESSSPDEEDVSEPRSLLDKNSNSSHGAPQDNRTSPEVIRHSLKVNEPAKLKEDSSL